MSDAFALSPSRRPSSRGERDHVLRRGAQLDADEVRVDVGAEEARVERMLELPGEEAVLARDHGSRRQTLGDLLRHVRPGEDGDRAPAHSGREALARLRVESLGEAQHGRLPRQRLHDLGERAARHGDDDEVDPRGRVGERDRLGSLQVDALQVVRVPARPRDRLRLLGRVTREHHVVAAVEEHACERRPPRAGADDQEPHRQDRFTKSIETGTPSRPKRARSRFSTQ
jgi:hypothetical protein